MKDIVGTIPAALFYVLGFRGSYHRMGGEVILEKLENGEVVEVIKAPGMWEQMCFGKDRVK